MALEDGVVLAETLAGGGLLEDRLRAFEERRFPRARLVQDVSRGILQAEMSINADNYDESVQGMRDHLVEQTHAVEQILNAPA
jgi:2-polyprenyl-6-methoxyphenol hydroxylase-like FAD-dependent oxidoreductase